MLQRWEASAAPSWAALGSVPPSFYPWQHWKRDKGVTKGVSPLGDKETSPVTLIPRDKRYQTSGLGVGFAFGIKPRPAAAFPTEVPISHCLQQQLSIIILLLQHPAPPDPFWGHKLLWQGPLAPNGARGGQRVSGGARPTQTPGEGWTGAVFSSSGDTRPQDEGCRRPLLVHDGKILIQGPPTQATQALGCPSPFIAAGRSHLLACSVVGVVGVWPGTPGPTQLLGCWIHPAGVGKAPVPGRGGRGMRLACAPAKRRCLGVRGRG